MPSNRAGLLPFGLWLGVTAVGVLLTPNPHGHGTHRQLGLPPCPSVLMFDRPCPGCGLTTSWTNLLHGRIADSFAAHPLGPPLYLTFTVLAFLGLRAAVRGRETMSLAAATRLTWVVVAFLLGFGAYRFATTPHYGDATERMLSGKGAARTAPDRP